jgi:uncharacterized phage protein (TIGR01671 family)
MSDTNAASANRFRFRAWNANHSNSIERMMCPVVITTHGKVTMPDGEEWAIPVMQSTGLLDKNGKEIFEGDIIKLHWPNRYGVYAVEWSTLSWHLRNKKGLWVASGGTIIQDEWDIKNPALENFSVIGNIYENPELLS